MTNLFNAQKSTWLLGIIVFLIIAFSSFPLLAQENSQFKMENGSTVLISGPFTSPPNTGYDIIIDASTDASIIQWSLTENGSTIASSGFTFDNHIYQTFRRNKPVGSYIYVFSFRGIGGAHGWPPYTTVSITVDVVTPPPTTIWYYKVTGPDNSATVEANIGDVAYFELDATAPNYVYGNIIVLFDTSKLESVSAEEDPNSMYGFWAWWTTATGMPQYHGGGNYYYYDTFGEGSDWAQEWVRVYGDGHAGPVGTIDPTYGLTLPDKQALADRLGIPLAQVDKLGAIRLYTSTYAGGNGTSPLRLGFRVLAHGTAQFHTLADGSPDNPIRYDWDHNNLDSHLQSDVEIIPAAQEADTEIKADQNPPKNNANTDCDPLWTNSGEFFQQVTDLTIPGRGFPFRFTRTYRAQIEFNGPLGYGWDFNYNERLVEKTADDKVLYFNGQARRDEFLKQLDGSYTAPVGFYVVLTKQVDGTFKLQERDGTVKIFASNSFSPGLYTLSSITDRNNNQMTFRYKPTGQLDQINDTLGRVIKVNWGDNGRISELEDFNAPVHRKIKYTIDDKFDLVAVTSPTTDDYPLGKTTRYKYSSGFADAKLNHNLQTITDPKEQEYLENKYNSDDRVYEQIYGDGTFLVSYEAQPDGTLKNTVFDRKNNKRIWYHNALGNAIRKEVYTAGGIITTNWEYNADGERTKTIFPETNSIEYTFDSVNSDRLAQGNLFEIRKKSHLGEPDIFTSFTYETRFNQVRTSKDARGNTTDFYFDYDEATMGHLNGDGRTDQANGNVVKIKYPDVTQPAPQNNIIATFWYNDFGQVIHAVDPEGIITVYVYSNGYLQKVIRDFNGADPATRNTTTEYAYDAVGNITGIRDAKLNWTIFEVNNLNQVTKTISRPPFNYEVKFFYDANDNLKEKWVQNIDEDEQPGNPEWIKTLYDYDTLDNLNFKNEWISATELPAITRYFRDANENMEEIRQPEGNIRKTFYDELNRVFQSIEGFGSDNPLVSINFYDNNNNLQRTEVGNGTKGTISYQYDGFDRRKIIANALGNYTVRYYDNNNNVIGVASYNNADRKLNETLYSYDELNRMYKVVQKKFDTISGLETDVVTTYWYDKNGRKWETVDAKGNATVTVFDNLDRIKSTTDALGNKKEYGYDANGNIETVTEMDKDDLGGTAIFVTNNGYDNLDRLIWTRDNLGNYTYYAHDSRNNLKCTIDRENHITRKNYDGLNRLKEVLYELTLTEAISVKYGLDRNGRLTALIDDNGNVTSYGYDGVNRLTSETFSSGGPNPKTKSYQFGQYGELLSVRDQNGNIINRVYDNALRLRRKDVIPATGVEGVTFESFGYDDLNRMILAQNDFSTVTMAYDSLGNLLNETQQIGTQSVNSVVSTYDELRFRTSLKYPNGRQISFMPDQLNRIDQIKEGVNVIADYDYVGSARVKGRTYQPNTANPMTLTVGYDGNRRVRDYQYIGTKVYTPTEWKNGKPKKYEWIPTDIGFEYTHDKEDNKLYEKRTHEGKGDAFVYDAIYRLTGVKYGVPNSELTIPPNPYDGYTYNSKEEFELDGVGNRETVSSDSTVVTYQPNNLNQYTSIDGITPQYDFNGNMTFDGYNTLTYDYANRPNRFENVAFIVEVIYDALGRRLQKKVTTKATGAIQIEGYVLDGVGVISDLDEFGVPNKDYIWGNGIDELLATAKGRSTNYDFHLYNSLGSVTHILNKNAEVEESYKYAAYGAVTIYDQKGEEIQKSKSKNRYLFTGREYDSETGLYYYRARYYSAQFGRFLESDKQRDSLANLYTYVNNNPLNFIDPSGWETKQPSAGSSRKEGNVAEDLHDTGVTNTGERNKLPEEQPTYVAICWARVAIIRSDWSIILSTGEETFSINLYVQYWIFVEGDITHVSAEMKAWGRLFPDDIYLSSEQQEPRSLTFGEPDAIGDRRGDLFPFSFSVPSSVMSDKPIGGRAWPVLSGLISVTITIDVGGLYPMHLMWYDGFCFEIYKVGENEYISNPPEPPACTVAPPNQ